MARTPATMIGAKASQDNFSLELLSRAKIPPCALPMADHNPHKNTARTAPKPVKIVGLMVMVDVMVSIVYVYDAMLQELFS